MIGLALWAGSYALAVNVLRQRYGWGARVSRLRQLAFYMGTLTVLIALASPLDELGDNYLFSAHMIQHMLLILVAPPLWLLGTPDWLIERLVAPGWPRQVLDRLTRPAMSGLIFVGTLWVWHLPNLYDLALEHEGVHILEHELFMAAAVIGWWPVLGPAHWPQRLPKPARAIYLLALMFPCALLAAVITFANRVLYPFYGHAAQVWGLTPLADQQLGGVLMWVPAHLIFLVTILIVVYDWLKPSSQASESDLTMKAQPGEKVG
jgi:putative membrane protein